MNVIGRATIPAEYFDRPSEMLLIAPEPRYLHARMIMSAVSMKLSADAGVAMPIPGRDLSGSGANYLKLGDMQFELADPIAEEAIRVIPDFSFARTGRNPTPGHVISFNRPRFTDSTYTMASREIPAGSLISTTPMSVGSDQVPLVVKRWGGPYNNTGTEIRPLGVSRFDAMFSVHSIPQIADLHFTRDFHKTLNSFGVALFDDVATANIVYPDGMTADNDSVVAGDSPMDFATLLKVQRTLDNGNIPAFSNGKRIFVGTPLQVEQLQRDNEFQRLAESHGAEVNPLLNKSYVKSAAGFDIYKSTTMTTSSNSSSVSIQYGQAFGPGMVGVGPAGMPRVAPSTVDNYGEDPMAIWLWYCAFGVLDNSFGCSVRTS